jgi:hypothetical protein
MQAAASNMIASSPEIGIKAYREEIGYFRPLHGSERLIDVDQEAREHGSIVAFKGAVFCILPTKIEGWTQIRCAKKSAKK